MRFIIKAVGCHQWLSPPACHPAPPPHSARRGACACAPGRSRCWCQTWRRPSVSTRASSVSCCRACAAAAAPCCLRGAEFTQNHHPLSVLSTRVATLSGGHLAALARAAGLRPYVPAEEEGASEDELLWRAGTDSASVLLVAGDEGRPGNNAVLLLIEAVRTLKPRPLYAQHCQATSQLSLSPQEQRCCHVTAVSVPARTALLPRRWSQSPQQQLCRHVAVCPPASADSDRRRRWVPQGPAEAAQEALRSAVWARAKRPQLVC